MKNPLAYGLVLLLAAPAAADVVHLRNGRSIEGRVVEVRQGQVHIEVAGGRIVLAREQVEHIEDAATPEEEYAQRARTTNMSDPQAVAKLASWASARGLGDQAAHLRALATGLDLEQRVGRAQVSGRVTDWMDVYRWSREHGLSTEVQAWVLERAVEVDREHPAVQAAQRELVREVEVTHTAAAKKPAPQPPQDDARVAELERELLQRQAEEQALKERVAQLERDRRLARRRRNRNPAVLPNDLLGGPVESATTSTAPPEPTPLGGPRRAP
jgi:hypothetical protein